MKNIGTIEAYGKPLRLQLDKYRGGATAIRIVGDDEEFGGEEPWGVLTVNIPGTPLAQDEILVKTWSENEPFRAPALATGLFEDTGRRIPSGFVLAEVWKLCIH